MAKSQFQPIFDYIDQTKKDTIEEILSQTASKKDIARLEKAVDAYAKQTKDFYQEVTVVIAKVSRMEAWIEKVAEKVGIKYQA